MPETRFTTLDGYLVPVRASLDDAAKRISNDGGAPRRSHSFSEQQLALTERKVKMPSPIRASNRF